MVVDGSIPKSRISNVSGESRLILPCPDCHHHVQVLPSLVPPVPARSRMLCPNQMLSHMLAFLQENKKDRESKDRERGRVREEGRQKETVLKNIQ